MSQGDEERPGVLHHIDIEPIVAIVGPTAVGKTAVGIEVARRLGGEIISADSQAVYRGLDIGTAKPTTEEQLRARFHLIDVVDPEQPFHAARYKALALEAIRDIAQRGLRVILVGGTGLYVRVLLDDYGLTSLPADIGLRAELEEEARREGATRLHARLAGLDPDAGARIHPNDRVRIVRALEVVTLTGVPISAQQRDDAARRRPLDAQRYGLRLQRDEMDRQIDARVDAMIAAGLEREARALVARYGGGIRSLRSLGYKEIVESLAGRCSLDEAIALAKRNTRRFARRQLTWFRADERVRWLDVDGMAPADVAREIVALDRSD